MRRIHQLEHADGDQNHRPEEPQFMGSDDAQIIQQKDHTHPG